MRFLPLRPGLAALLLLGAACPPAGAASVDEIPDQIIVSVRDQKLMLVQDGKRIATFKVSTSKFGLGDTPGSMATPLGLLRVVKKIGDNAPTGAVFHHRRFTGEILPPNAPGRDPITTRIIWLSGLEPQNARAFARCIYIHGTPEEKRLGKPASYGCIRMRARDVANLYKFVPLGAIVNIIPDALPRLPKGALRPLPGSNIRPRLESDDDIRTRPSSPFHNSIAQNSSRDRGA